MNNKQLKERYTYDLSYFKFKDHDYTKDIWLISFISSAIGAEITTSSKDYVVFTDKDYKEVCTITKNNILINDNYDDNKMVYLLVGYCAYQNYKHQLEYIEGEE